MDADTTIPLLRVVAPTPAAVPILSSAHRYAISFFSIVHIFRGLCFMVYPALGLSSFGVPQSGPTFLLGTILGGRDILLGGLLFTADRNSAREMWRSLLVNLLSDAMDTVILIFSAACAWHVRMPLAEIMFVAAMAIMEHLALFTMSESEQEDGAKGYQTMLRVREDSKQRMQTWIAEMRLAEENEGTMASQSN